MAEPTTAKEQPSVTSLTNLVQDFPLDDNEVIVVRETPERDHVIYPYSIVPTSRTTSRYDVGIKKAALIGDESGRLTALASFYSQTTVSISTLIEFMDRGEVVQKREVQMEATDE